MKEDDLAPPLCVFCGAPWDEPMIRNLYISDGCDTCGYGAVADGTIEVNCSSCGRLVYQKEFRGVS